MMSINHGSIDAESLRLNRFQDARTPSEMFSKVRGFRISFVGLDVAGVICFVHRHNCFLIKTQNCSFILSAEIDFAKIVEHIRKQPGSTWYVAFSMQKQLERSVPSGTATERPGLVCICCINDSSCVNFKW